MGQNFSWLEKVGHGLIDEEYDDNEHETSETKSEEFALKTNVLAFASRSKAKAKPQRSTSHLQEMYLLVKEDGLILKQELNRISLISD